ncbi:Uncharacterised protein [Mycobacteroides abscessus subsp. abscessus]|nr:Uncharacterised protein [Mycobacteroides abscessus subsp. abscessus]
MRDRGDPEYGPTTFCEFGFDEVGQFVGLGHVGLVQDHHARALGEVAEAVIGVQRRFVRRELGFERVDIGDRITARFQRGEVDDVREHRAAFEMP